MPDEFRKEISVPLSGQVKIGGKDYVPIYIGAREAEMMLKENLFAKEGDLLEDFFGNAVIISGILPRTGTVLDELHFVPAGFRLSR